MMGKLLARICVLLGVIVLFSLCYEEKFETSTGIQLRFSVDTLRFDTVFTSVGSATRSIKVHNPSDLFVRTSIRLDQPSFFRINVDGVSYAEGLAEDVEIWPKDSIYLFLEVTVDPDQPLSVSPFVISEQLEFNTNGNIQKVYLEAWGQNANYLPQLNAGGTISVLSCDLAEVSWDDPKPYVIYGLLAVDSCTLRIPAGTQVYIHGGIARNSLGIYNDGIIWLLSKGTIKIDGTADHPVIFQGDRLEPDFNEIPGQWAGLRIGSGSRNNEISHAIIRNSIVGLRADSASQVTLKNTVIENTTGSGIIGVRSQINMENCLVHSNGGYGLQFIYGGNYNINYCTVASYGNQAEALLMTNFICRSQDCSEFDVFRLIANARNSIFFGNSKDEINLVDATGEGSFEFEYRLNNCVVRVEELLKNAPFDRFPDKCRDCLQPTNDDPLFANVDMRDFHLDSLSVAIDKAAPIGMIDFDLEGNPRGEIPDIGCFERTK